MLWIKVGSVECGKLVDWAACVCATIDYPGSFYMCPTVQCIMCSEIVYTAHCMKQ